MASNAIQPALQQRFIPKTLLPLLSTSLNVGMALGGYITTIPFYNADYPGPAIALWFKDFFKPGFVGVTTLGALTLGSGLRAFWFHYQGAEQKQPTVSRWILAGLFFTLLHFGFGNKASYLWDLGEVVSKTNIAVVRCCQLWTKSYPSQNLHSSRCQSGSACMLQGR